jgi:hypothetical protein
MRDLTHFHQSESAMDDVKVKNPQRKFGHFLTVIPFKVYVLAMASQKALFKAFHNLFSRV